MGRMCSWGIGVDGGRDGENRAHGGSLEGVFSEVWSYMLCVITMRASLASPSRLTGMVICVCVIAIVEEKGECRF